MRNFREYHVWVKSIQIAKEVYEVSSEFPETERFGLISQVRRAAVSISSNIAEGCGRNSPQDFARMLEIALGSCFEVESQLYLAAELHFTNEDRSHPVVSELKMCQKQLHSLIEKLRRANK